MKTNSIQDELLLLPNGSRRRNQTDGFLSIQGIDKKFYQAPYIIYSDKNKTCIYDIDHYLLSNAIRHPLTDFIRKNDMYSYTIVCYPVKVFLENFQNTDGASLELKSFLIVNPDALAIYIVAHKTGGHELLTSIGGDCYRPDRSDLLSMLIRTRDLSTGMLRKAALIFPDIPALSGGKKGEFGVINRSHKSISNSLSDDAIFQLSALIMPIGIEFLNRKIK